MKREIRKLKRVGFPNWVTAPLSNISFAKTTLAILIVTAFALSLAPITSFVLNDDQYVSFLSWDYWLGSDEVIRRSEVVRNLGLVVAAFVAGGLAVWRSMINQLQVRISERGQITDRFAGAIELLEADAPILRAGGIYALGQIARDSVKRDHIAIAQILTSFIRHSPYADEREQCVIKYFAELKELESEGSSINKSTEPKTLECPDLVAAIEVLNSRSARQRFWESAKSHEVSLKRARLPMLNLQNANFVSADLRRANFNGADLGHAKLCDANLFGASFKRADLRSADFTDASLNSTTFEGANLTAAILTGASLNGTQISQDMLNTTFPSAPPKSLPSGLKWPFIVRGGKWVRKE